jgi:hypothetical protein
MRRTALASLLLLLPSLARANAEPIHVEAIFALDTTGSMGGLIDGAKRQIWFIANLLQKARPRPLVRIGLVGYRDLGDDYVTRQFPLTESIDDLHSELMRFVAGGGGDEPEHVNRALQVAIERMSWRRQGKVLRLIFLVGDAPPHEGREGLYSAALAAQAKKAEIIINSLLCGEAAEAERAWRSIAAAAGGGFVKIPRDGGVKLVPSPVDQHLARFNQELTRMALPTGDERTVREARQRLDWNRKLGVYDQAESATFRARSGKLDAADLLYLLGKGKKLRDIPVAQLPPELRELAAPEREALLRRVVERRAVVNDMILRLARERDAYREKLSDGKASLEASLRSLLKQQGARVGLTYE